MGITERDAPLAQRLVGLSWFTDGITQNERRTLIEISIITINGVTNKVRQRIDQILSAAATGAATPAPMLGATPVPTPAATPEPTPQHGEDYGYTDLHNAVYISASLVEELLDNGADVNAKANDGSTPLHLAVEHNFLAVVALLLEYGADINAKDDWGLTPWDLAQQNRQPEIVELLRGTGR